ncbi:MAG TPA: DNA alkylation repair protein [Tepidisphaeraceae bacterium]|nr:DNA alkylation repair protein [Tepidisphaeraceae bacterium]
MNATEVMKQLEKMGSEQQRKTYERHGCTAPIFGVKIADLKTIVKKVKSDTALAKELYRTGNGDAMYLAGLIANGKELSRKELDEWAAKSPWSMISGYTVPWVAAEHPQGWEAAMKWINSSEEKITISGWNTLGAIVSMREDKDLDIAAIEKLLDRVVKEIGKAPNDTRYAMNGFIIAVGSYIKPLTKKALASAEKIGCVEVELCGACKLPAAVDYIKKVIAKGTHGKKRTTVKC